MKDTSAIEKMLLNMHCHKCCGEFDKDSIKIMRDERGLLVVQIKCERCKRCFGMAFLGLGLEELNSCFKTQKQNSKYEPISYDDVLDAHNFFQNMDENWAKYLENKETRP